MNYISSGNLKSILHSKRANCYYLEYCRVLVNGGRVEYVTEAGHESLYWNIPIANTTFVLLGTGTSITQAAMREFGKAGVVVGFCGGDSTPLFMAQDAYTDILWQLPQSEYRPTEYLQQWVSFWFDDIKRCLAGKIFQNERASVISKFWLNSTFQKKYNFNIDELKLTNLLHTFQERVSNSSDSSEILLHEALLTKELYKLASRSTHYGEFSRCKDGSGTDVANKFLDHGNYLAYGLAASASWVLGIPHSLSVLHGKTRRGGLVFDMADIIKDAIILPRAFIFAMNGNDEQEFRKECTNIFVESDVMEIMIKSVKTVLQTICSGNLK